MPGRKPKLQGLQPQQSDRPWAMQEKFQCSVGKEWKPLDAYSKKNIAIVDRKLRLGERLDPANTGMVCRQHSDGPREELRCQGPCNLVKPLNAFSKNTRRKGMDLCTSCSAWVTTCDPGMTPFAAPNNPVSYDESKRVYTVFDITDEVFDTDEGQPLAPVTSLAELSMANLYDIEGPDGDTTEPGKLPPSDQLSTIGDRSATSNVRYPFARGRHASSKAASVAAADCLPPHLRAEPDLPGLRYNAFDPQGEAHTQYKLPTAASSTIGDSTLSSRPTKSTKSAWAKPTRLPYQEMKNFQFDYRDADPVLGDSESADEM